MASSHLSFRVPAIKADPSSAANISEYQVTHYDFDWEFDFGKRELNATVKLHVTVNPELSGRPKLSLDVHCLEVESVKNGDAELPFDTTPFAAFGSSLNVDVSGATVVSEGKEDASFALTIKYRAGSGPAMCWLFPEQTAGKVLPYMFTQGQACLNRSMFPCHDTPSVRCTYTAAVRVGKDFSVVMAAKRLNRVEDSKLIGEPVAGREDVHQFNFIMDQSIPVYLLAMAIGDLRTAAIGPRSSVWAEPSVLEAATYEFSEITEQYVAAGEKLFGPYHWEVYDILVMPPSFPYGGMENPRLTFVTPCLLAGDRSLGDVVAHEIAHSWFGNLVTNASWGEFFLNEGFTMYAQRRITSVVSGVAFTALETTTGLACLCQDMDAFGHDSIFTRLRVPMEQGVDPDDTYNQTPYEKGFCFLCYLRSVVGSDEAFDGWLREYCQSHKFRSITSETMLECFFAHFPALKESGLATREGQEFDKWLNAPGMPSFTPDLSAAKELTTPAEAAAAKWLSGDAAQREAAAAENFGAWPTYQRLHFLDTILNATGELAGGHEVLDLLDRSYSLSGATNAEVRVRWAQIVAKYSYEAGFASVRGFLQYQGKQRYVIPIYRALVAGSEATRKLGVDVYSETARSWHVNVANRVKGILTSAGALSE